MAEVKKRLSQAAHPAGLLSLLNDESRLKIFAAVVLGASNIESIASQSGLSPGTVRRIVSRLLSAGLILERKGRLEVNTEVIDRAAKSSSTSPDPGIKTSDPTLAAELGKFFRDGRLHTIPANFSKLLLVLDYIASLFEPGRYYSEREVNAIIHKVHDDHAQLRRYLVDQGLLARRKGRYWRVGGTFEVDS